MNRNVIVGTLFIFSICILFALVTDHRWEDWYITYRASKNFAFGHGLRFNVGETAVMSYTSPIGTLTPALIKYLFIHQSDEFTIWVYRVICSIVLACSTIFIYRLITFLKYPTYFFYLALLFFGLNFLIIDNTINGMESSFMVFFELYLIYILITFPKNFIRQLALCFAGIMFTRPDGFIYAGTIISSFFLFRVNAHYNRTSPNLKKFGLAIVYAMLLFIPWIIITSMYYGTPIPHTIIAKSKNYTFLSIFMTLGEYLISFRGSPNLFLPAYAVNFGGWGFFKPVAQILSCITLLYWLLPKGQQLIRALSLASFLMILYLNVISGQGASPWYLPSVITPSLIVLVLIIQRLHQNLTKSGAILFFRVGSFLSVIAIVVFMASNFYYGMRMIKYQQKIVENGNRKQIGLWLKMNSKPKDRVFMECLGYIGFFSNLKTFDFPGMSSPEVVRARKKLNSNKYSAVINELKPEWLVLRAGEATEIKKEIPQLLGKEYSLAKVFDVRKEIEKAHVQYGEPFLHVDGLFEVYHKN